MIVLSTRRDAVDAGYAKILWFLRLRGWVLSELRACSLGGFAEAAMVALPVTMLGELEAAFKLGCRTKGNRTTRRIL